METKSAIIGVYETHLEAVEAIKILQNAGYPINHVSLIGKEEAVKNIEGAHTWDDSISGGTKIGSFIGGILGVLAGMSFIALPGVGVVFVGGTLAAAALGAVQGSVLGALGGGLVGTIFGAIDHGTEGSVDGDPAPEEAEKRKYRKHLNAGRFILVVHGSKEENAQASTILKEHTNFVYMSPNEVISRGLGL